MVHPSKKRYDERKPVIAFRVGREVKDEIDAMRGDKPYSEFFGELMDIYKKHRSLMEWYEELKSDGLRMPFGASEEDLIKRAMRLECSGCGRCFTLWRWELPDNLKKCFLCRPKERGTPLDELYPYSDDLYP